MLKKRAANKLARQLATWLNEMYSPVEKPDVLVFEKRVSVCFTVFTTKSRAGSIAERIYRLVTDLVSNVVKQNVLFLFGSVPGTSLESIRIVYEQESVLAHTDASSASDLHNFRVCVHIPWEQSR